MEIQNELNKLLANPDVTEQLENFEAEDLAETEKFIIVSINTSGIVKLRTAGFNNLWEELGLLEEAKNMILRGE